MSEAASENSSLGLPANVAGALCYLLGFITGIVFFILEKDSKFVKFHAMQSIITFGAIFVISFVLGFIPIIGWLLAILLAPVSLILWILLMVMAFQGKKFSLPVIGGIAEGQAG